MKKPELILSNTTSFFTGDVEKLFQNAKRYGFSYVEIIPYRWTDPQQILALQEKYNVKVAGIHMPDRWDASVWTEIVQRTNLFAKFLPIIFNLYLGKGIYSPGLKLAELLKRQNQDFYLLFHADLVIEMDNNFLEFSKHYNTAIENIPFYPSLPEFAWLPSRIKKEFGEKVKTVFDPGHFHETVAKKKNINLIEEYRLSLPEIMHIGYNDYPPLFHTLPRPESQKELVNLLKIHKPKYIVLETNPFISIKKGKKLLDQIINASNI